MAALPVARLRLRPDDRATAGGLLRRAGGVPGRGARRRHLRAAARGRRARAHGLGRAGGDARRVGRRHGVRHGRALQPRLRRRAAARPRPAASSASSASGTRAPPRSPPPPTASSPAVPRPASRSPGPARPTCSPACTTPSSTALRCSRSPGRCRRRCWAGARSRTSTCRRSSATSRSPRSPCTRAPTTPSWPPPRSSTRSTAAASPTSCSPTRCRTSPRTRPPHGPPAAGPTCASRRAGALDAALDLLRAARRPVIIVGQGARGATDERARAGRAARRPGAHDVPRQGPGARHPPARRGRARPLRHARGVLADERVRPAARGRRVVLQPHRASRRTSRSCRSTTRPSAIGRFHPVDVGVLGDADGHAAGAARPGSVRPRPSTSAPDVAARWAIWRAEKARRAARRPRPRRRQRRRLRRADRTTARPTP